MWGWWALAVLVLGRLAFAQNCPTAPGVDVSSLSCRQLVRVGSDLSTASTLGSITLAPRTGQKALFLTGGTCLLSNSYVVDQLATKMQLIDSSVFAYRVAPIPSPSLPLCKAANNEVILMADQLIIGDDITVIIPVGVKMFTIAALELHLGRRSRITWQTVNDLSKRPPTPDAITTFPAQIPFYGAVGWPGYKGLKGEDGLDGEDAPRLFIFAARSFTGALNVQLQGQDGQHGGTGGQGGRGGRGGEGKDGRVFSRNPTDGGPGGVGGQGGDGGDGGNGGDAGMVTVYAPEALRLNVTSLMTLTTAPGAAGVEGAGGLFGQGGPGGSGGRRRYAFSSPGRDGRTGGIGDVGTPGTRGQPGRGLTGLPGEASFTYIVLQPGQLDFPFPVISRAEPVAVAKDQRVRLLGNKFTAPGTMRIVLRAGGVGSGAALPAEIVITSFTLVSSTELTFVYPGGFPGPTVDVVLDKSGSLKSNPLALWVSPSVQSVSQGTCRYAAGEQPREGSCTLTFDDATVTGDGFNEHTAIFFNGRPLPRTAVRSVTTTSLVFRPRRPEAAGVRDEAGELVSLSLASRQSGPTQPSVTVRVFLMTDVILFVGDSVTRGHGNLDHRSWWSVVCQDAKAQLGDQDRDSFVSCLNVAQTGAVSTAQTPPGSTLGGPSSHIPRSFPSTVGQLNMFLTSSASLVSGVMVDGRLLRRQVIPQAVVAVVTTTCANDVGLDRVASSSPGTIRRLVQNACPNAVQTVAQLALRLYPRAIVVVSDYYLPLSSAPRLSAVWDMMTGNFVRDATRILCPGDPMKVIAGVAADQPLIGLLTSSVVYGLLVDRGDAFFHATRRAIAETVSKLNNKRVVLASCAYGHLRSRAAYGSKAATWEFDDIDDRFSTRASQCPSSCRDKCAYSHVLHPSPAAASQYGPEIVEAVVSYVTQQRVDQSRLRRASGLPELKNVTVEGRFAFHDTDVVIVDPNIDVNTDVVFFSPTPGCLRSPSERDDLRTLTLESVGNNTFTISTVLQPGTHYLCFQRGESMLTTHAVIVMERPTVSNATIEDLPEGQRRLVIHGDGLRLADGALFAPEGENCSSPLAWTVRWQAPDDADAHEPLTQLASLGYNRSQLPESGQLCLLFYNDRAGLTDSDLLWLQQLNKSSSIQLPQMSALPVATPSSSERCSTICLALSISGAVALVLIIVLGAMMAYRSRRRQQQHQRQQLAPQVLRQHEQQRREMQIQQEKNANNDAQELQVTEDNEQPPPYVAATSEV